VQFEFKSRKRQIALEIICKQQDILKRKHIHQAMVQERIGQVLTIDPNRLRNRLERGIPALEGEVRHLEEVKTNSVYKPSEVKQVRTKKLIQNVKLLRNQKNWTKVIMPNIHEERGEGGTGLNTVRVDD